MLLEFCNRKEITTVLETNGTLIDEGLASSLRKYDVHVGLSVDSHIADVHDELRGVRGCFDKMLEGPVYRGNTA